MDERRDSQPMDIRNRYAGYQVYDRHYEKVGKVDDLFVDERTQPEYIGVRLGLLGTRSTLIPMEIIRINDRRRLMEAAADRATIEQAPAFGDEEITPEIEDRIHSHFGVTREGASLIREGVSRNKGFEGEERADSGVRSNVDVEYGERAEPGVPPSVVDTRPQAERKREYTERTDEPPGVPGGTTRIGDPASGDVRNRNMEYLSRSERENRDVYGVDSGKERDRDRVSRIIPANEERLDEEHDQSGRVGAGMTMGNTETGKFRRHAADDKGLSQREGSYLEDANELRVQRSEEELRAGTREREAGSVNVRKRVRTDRERLRVPKRHEEVSVERVPVEEGTASEGEIGDDEIRVPVVEEEVVVEKRPAVKEELRIRKNVVEEEEIIEEDVRREEVEIDDDTKHHGD